ncbi:MAG: hypothetical protein WA993_18145 [Candidatus Binatus sp.]|jgi:hypothetical protein
MGLRISVGEKFASLVFTRCDLRLFGGPSATEVGHGLWVSTGDELPFELDTWWHRQLGDIVADNLENEFSFCLTAKQPSKNPRILDAEVSHLERRVAFFAWGVVLSVGAPHFDLARIVSGGKGEEGFRLKLGTVEHFVRPGGLPRPIAEIEDFVRAARFTERIASMEEERNSDAQLYWRAFSGLDAYQTAVKSPLAHVKLHQFVRAIESFLPSKASGELAFSEYCKNLCPANEAELREVYRLRNLSEHHRPFAHAFERVSDPAKTADRRLRQAEMLCRELFRRFFADLSEFEIHFRDDSSLKRFWRDTSTLERAWGPKLDLNVTA